MEYKRIVDNKMKSYGDIDLDKKIIRINKDKSKKNPLFKLPVNRYASKYPDILDSIVHEEQHRKYSKMTEKEVDKKTKELVQELSRRRKQQLYNKYKA